jgi:hypothetical protein
MERPTKKGNVTLRAINAPWREQAAGLRRGNIQDRWYYLAESAARQALPYGAAP